MARRARRARKSRASQREELQRTITEQMVASLEKVEAQGWTKGWGEIGISSLPHNPTTGKQYSGQNTVFLLFSGFESSAFAGYGQWQKAGCQVRAGERATTVTRYVPYERIVENEQGEEEVKTYWNLLPLKVFNSTQVDGWEEPTVETINPDQRDNGIEMFIEKTGAKIKEVAQDSAFYRPSTDTITMPAYDQFKSSYDYYSVACHELAHWTGHSTRLERDLSGVKSSSSYAKEELIAELSSVYTCAHLGLQAQPKETNSQYIKGWLRSLNSDPKWVFQVAGDASKATQYLIDQSQ